MQQQNEEAEPVNLALELKRGQSAFYEVAAPGVPVNFEREARFAWQALQANSFLMSIAMDNTVSLRAAVTNVAAVGLTLNPVLGQAYLVPRKAGPRYAVCLDIGAAGFVELAMRSGRVKTIHYGLVYSNDTFRAPTPGALAVHQFDPFKPRGEMVGAYAQLVLADGTPGPFSTLDMDGINKRKESSDGWKAHHAPKKGKEASKSCIWCDWFEEMAVKSVLRASRRHWPQTPALELAHQISVANSEPALVALDDDETPQIEAPAGSDPGETEAAARYFAGVDPADVITEEQCGIITNAARTAGVKLETICSKYAVDAIENLRPDDFGRVIGDIDTYARNRARRRAPVAA